MRGQKNSPPQAEEKAAIKRRWFWSASLIIHCVAPCSSAAAWRARRRCHVRAGLSTDGSPARHRRFPRGGEQQVSLSSFFSFLGFFLNVFFDGRSRGRCMIRTAAGSREDRRDARRASSSPSWCSSALLFSCVCVAALRAGLGCSRCTSPLSARCGHIQSWGRVGRGGEGRQRDRRGETKGWGGRASLPAHWAEAGVTEFDLQGWMDGWMDEVRAGVMMAILRWSHAVKCGTSVTVMSEITITSGGAFTLRALLKVRSFKYTTCFLSARCVIVHKSKHRVALHAPNLLESYTFF